jgi:hypothetical protein
MKIKKDNKKILKGIPVKENVKYSYEGNNTKEAKNATKKLKKKIKMMKQ